MAETSTLPEVKPRAEVRLGEWLRALASLRLTVVLFSLSLILVFVGTLAQMDQSIWTVVRDYFRSWGVWVPLNLFVRLGQVFLGLPTSMALPAWVAFPFPGGLTLGSLLLVNLIAAHLSRFRLGWNRAGILVAHAGVVLLLIGELITGLYQVEATMSLVNGETVNYTDVSHECELALVVPGGDADREITVSERLLRGGKRISDPKLPVDIDVVAYSKNSALREGGDVDPLTASNGAAYTVQMGLKESTGVDGDADYPAARLRFLSKDGGQVLAEGVFSLWQYHNNPNLRRAISFPPRLLKVGDQEFQVSLRPRREYRPYSLRLLEFKHDVYMGTQTPKNFSSLVRLTDPERGVEREALIYMNSPLRYRGETYYQSGFFPGDIGTILQVVRNPGWLLPYIACTLVTLGLSAHFLQMLARFLRRRALA